MKKDWLNQKETFEVKDVRELKGNFLPIMPSISAIVILPSRQLSHELQPFPLTGPLFLVVFLQPLYNLISISTPDGRFSLVKASIVLELVSIISIRRL